MYGGTWVERLANVDKLARATKDILSAREIEEGSQLPTLQKCEWMLGRGARGFRNVDKLKAT